MSCWKSLVVPRVWTQDPLAGSTFTTSMLAHIISIGFNENHFIFLSKKEITKILCLILALPCLHDPMAKFLKRNV